MRRHGLRSDRTRTRCNGEATNKTLAVSPEDITLAKLEWYRPDGEISDRQWQDILGVLKTRAGELDLDYLWVPQ